MNMTLLLRNQKQLSNNMPSTAFKVIGLAGLLTISGCGSLDSYQQNQNSRTLTTLGDIYSNPMIVKRVERRAITAQDAINTYQEVYDETDDLDIKAETSIRMANLNLIATDDRIFEQGTLADLIDGLEQENEKLTALPDDPDPVIAQEKQTLIQSNNEKIIAARNKIDELDNVNLTFFKQAVDIYEKVLSEHGNAEGNDKILYQLATSYDAQGDQESMVIALDRIAKNHPESVYYTEVQFRLAEAYFSDGDYIASAEAYEEVINSGTDTRFAQHSLYKHGWSLYKLSEYRSAIEMFITLRDQLTPDAANTEQSQTLDLQRASNSNEKLINETDRVMSLAFSHLEGPEELFNYFKEIGGRSYELEIYTQLHANYEKQERYRDAGKTYDIFLEAYPDHKQAPTLQTEILQAYSDGGFPSLLVPGKIAYVKRFGINSEYWKKYVDDSSPERNYNEEEKLALVEQIKTHLADVSKFYHAKAQGSKKQEDYLAAATWYREYLDTFGNEEGVDTPETLEIRKLLAESLFDSGQESLAAIEFEKLARSSGDNREAGANASYFALLSYQKMVDKFQGGEEGKNLLIAKKIESSNYFIENFQDDERMPNALGNIISDQIALKDYEGSVKNSRVLVALDPPASLELQRTAWVTIANAEFDGKDYLNAEQSYQKVLEFDGFDASQRAIYTQQIAASIFKNAEAIKEKGDLNAAAEEFLRLGEVSPDSNIRPKAYFDAANIYIEAEEWQKSIDTLNKFKGLYPNHELIDTLPDKLAIAYKNTNQYSLAASQYLILSNRYEATDKELARQTLWEAALLSEKAEDQNNTLLHYRKYANTYKQPLEQNFEAQNKLVEIYKEGKDKDEYKLNLWRSRIITSYENAGNQNTPRTTYLAAQMSFESAEQDYTRFKRIKLSQPLKKSLTRKKAQMDVALGKYENVSNLGSADWTTAANHRIARIYQILGEDLMSSERPKGLNDDQLEQYGYLIEDQAIPFEDKAIEVFAINSQLVGDNVYDKWVKSSFEQLAKLIPGRYAKFEKRESYVESIY